MENTSVEDELTPPTASKRPRLCKSLETFKADSSQMLKSLHDHLEIVVAEVELKENQLQSLSINLGKIQEQIEQQTDKLKATEIETVDNEKELHLLRNQIKSEEKTLIELKTAVESTQKKLELKKQELRLRSVLVKHEQQPIAAESQLFSRDAQMLGEFSSASPSRCEVSTYLKAISTPAKFVLDLLEEQIRKAQKVGLDLDDLVVENLVLFFEELLKIEGSDKSQMQLKAKQLATLWKGLITIEAPRSSLEALAFLLFIVAYDLKSLINEEETVLLATSVFHHEQGPRLFHLLGLKRKIPEIVRELVEDRQYIPAVRIICLCKLKDFSATTLLMKEITDLRHSSLRKVEKKDVGKLRAIVELVADYKLDIDIPGDLIAKLMFLRENSTPPVLRCSVEMPEEINTSSSNPEATTSYNLAAATRSSLDFLVPKREFKPFVNTSTDRRL